MDIRHLKIFITVVEENSITKAANKLLMAQPAISLAIKQMEEYYNVQLFIRFKQRIYLTNTGRIFYQKALKIIDDFNNLKINLKTEDNIKIGSSISIGSSLLPNILPKNKFKLFIRTTSDIIEMIENDILEFGIIEGYCYNQNIAVNKFFTDKLVLVAKPGYCSKKIINLEETNHFNFLLRDKGSGTRDYFDSILKTKDYEIKPLIDSLSYEALINYAKLGFGIAVIPYSLAIQSINNLELEEIKIKGITFEREISYIYKKGKILSQNINELIEILKGVRP